MSGILSDLDMNEPRRRTPAWPDLPAPKGLLVRHRSTGYVGTVQRCTPDWVTIRDQNGRMQTLRNERGAFSVKGSSVTLVPATTALDESRGITPSGSVAVRAKARVAQPSRILVEGLHDAELVEKVWGDDLRLEGIVVEPLHGADDLPSVVDAFDPHPHRRLGILLDHLTDGTKETRIASQIHHPDVLITGHPYVDVWQAIRPNVLGFTSWPVIPKGVDWKQGICDAFGFDGPPAVLWRTMLKRVTSYRDLEPPLVGAMEELIDFVAPPSTDD